MRALRAHGKSMHPESDDAEQGAALEQLLLESSQGLAACYADGVSVSDVRNGT